MMVFRELWGKIHSIHELSNQEYKFRWEYPTKSQTTYKCTRHVASVLSMMYILYFNVFADHIPAFPNTSMETARHQEMISIPFLNVGKFFQCTILVISISSISSAPSDLSFGMSVLISLLLTTVSTA